VVSQKSEELTEAQLLEKIKRELEDIVEKKYEFSPQKTKNLIQ
jgi:hypothetical protein